MAIVNINKMGSILVDQVDVSHFYAIGGKGSKPIIAFDDDYQVILSNTHRKVITFYKYDPRTDNFVPDNQSMPVVGITKGGFISEQTRQGRELVRKLQARNIERD